MQLKKAVILKAFTRWGKAYTIGETVEDRVDKIGVLVHERKARLLKPEQATAPESQPAPQAPEPWPTFESRSQIPQPSPAAAPSSPAQPPSSTGGPTEEDYRELEGELDAAFAPEGADAVIMPRRTRKGKPKSE